MKTCDGVSDTKSLASLESGIIGREFNVASIWAVSVTNSLKVRWTFPAILPKWYLIDFTAASHKPPKWGEPARLKCQFIFLGANFSIFNFCSKIVDIVILIRDLLLRNSWYCQNIFSKCDLWLITVQTRYEGLGRKITKHSDVHYFYSKTYKNR